MSGHRGLSEATEEEEEAIQLLDRAQRISWYESKLERDAVRMHMFIIHSVRLQHCVLVFVSVYVGMWGNRAKPW